MSSAKVVVKHAFGISPNPKNSLAFVEDHQLVYVCGHQAVLVNTETKDQSFIQGTTQPYQSLGITALACSAPKKIIALAERADPVAAVTFYDSQSLRRRKILQYTELGSREIRCIAFSTDGRLCLTQGAGPEWNLVLWNVEKAAKMIACVKISSSEDTVVHQVSFCPWDANVIIVIGKSLVRLFKIAEGQLRPVSVNIRRDQSNFISHTWLWDDKLILGTEGGEILLLENFEYRAVIYPTGAPPPGVTEELTPILSLAPISKGFVAGTTGGELKLFEKTDEVKEQFRLEDTFNVPKGKPSIVGIALGSSEDSLVCATDSQQLFYFALNNSNLLKDGSGSGFDYLFTSFHGPGPSGEAAITGIDVALWKPVVVTCGKDCTVRVWNINDRKIEQMKEFPEEPTSLSMHPSGIYVVVGFVDKLRLLSILLDDLYVSREFNVRNCPEVKFSKGGQYIAAVNSSNIQVFATYTGMLVSTLRGHNGRIRSLIWTNNDAKLYSVGSEGSVFLWEVYKGARLDQYTGPMPNSAGVGFADGSKVFTATTDRMLKEITIAKLNEQLGLNNNSGDGGGGGALSVQAGGGGSGSRQLRELPLPFHVNCLAIEEGRKILFAGTSEGDQPGSVLSVMASPQLSSSYEMVSIHSGPITSMCLSRDGSLLFTGDTDGCLCISEIESSTGRVTTKAKDSGTATFDFVEEVLIHKSDLEERKARISELSGRVEELTLNNEYQLRLKEIEHNDKIKDITVSVSAQLESETGKYENLQKEKFIMERDYREQMGELEEKHENELVVVESRYKAKLSAEAARHRQLTAETEEMHRKWNEENQALVESHQNYLQNLTSEYEEKLQAEHGLQRRLQAEKETLQVEHDIIRSNIEGDADVEVDDMKSRYEVRLRIEEETAHGLIADHTFLKKTLQLLNKDADSHKEDIRRLRDKEARLVDNIKSLEKDIQSHKKEIREREETITDKEKRIFDLKKKNQELEKFRFVLDYKIKELKLQIAPRETEIATMRKQIEEMDLELEQYHKSNAALNLMIGELKLKLEGLRKEQTSQNSRVTSNSRLLERLMRDLQDTFEVRGEYTLLKAKVIGLYQLYVQGDVLAAEVGAPKKDSDDQLQQYNRDREQMERNLDALRRSLKTDALMHKRDLAKMMRENVLLTREINDLRKDAQSMLLQQRAVEKVVASAGPKSNLPEMLESLGIGLGKKTNPGVPGGAPNMASTAPGPARAGPVGAARRLRIQRTTALRTSSAGAAQGHTISLPLPPRNDLREAWREIDMQNEQIVQLEEQLKGLCASLNLDHSFTMKAIDSSIDAMSRK